MSVYGRILLAGLGSLALLLGAFGFQYLGKLAPCSLCLWQRWPHAAAAVLALVAMTVLWRYRRALAGIGALVMAGSAVLAIYHAGVEQKWWAGPGGCSSTIDATGLSTEDLLAQIRSTPIVVCDEIVWDLFGITMAGWNAIVSLGLAVLWAFAAWPKTVTRHHIPG